MKKGQKMPVRLFDLAIGETITDEHVAQVQPTLKLKQGVTVKIGTIDRSGEIEACLVVEARQV